MSMQMIIMSIGIMCAMPLSGFTIQHEPVHKIYTQNSILEKKENYKPRPVSNRMRYATCTGAAWFHGEYLAILNLFGNHLTTYRANKESETLETIQLIENKDGTKFDWPEHLDVSHDGRFLAVANSRGSSINIYLIDLDTHLITPSPIFSLATEGLIHTVRFSSDDAYLAYGSFDSAQSLCVNKIVHSGEKLTLSPGCKEANHSALKLKGICFSNDNRYLALTYALSLANSQILPLQSLLVIRTFNASNGTVGEIISSVPGTFSTEDIILSNNNDAIIMSDQAHDALIIYPFDPETGLIDPNATIIENPEAQLSFPHGMALSEDGNYLVVANYGDDSFNLYRVES